MASEDENVPEQIVQLQKENADLYKHLSDVELKYQAKLSASAGDIDDEFSSRHLNFISELFENELFSDMVITFQGGYQIHGHRSVIAAQSEYLAKLDLQFLDLTDLSYEIAYAVIKWMYTDIIEIESRGFLESLSLLAVEYNIKALLKRCKIAEDYIPALIEIEAFEQDVNQVTDDSQEVEDEQEENKLKLRDLLEAEDTPSSPTSDHDGTVTPVKPNKCDVCEKIFETIEDLSSHRRLFHVKRHKCPECDKGYKKPYELAQHINTVHKKLKRFKCELCDGTFSFKHGLKAHQRRHAGVDKFPCQLCKKMFSSKGNLDVHLRVHTGERPYKCEYCNQSFAQLVNKKDHQRIHTGERPYECKYCNKRFVSLSDKHRHVKIHENKRPYQCEFCLRKFSQSAHLNKHLNIHAEEITKPDQMDDDK